MIAIAEVAMDQDMESREEERQKLLEFLDSLDDVSTFHLHTCVRYVIDSKLACIPYERDHSDQ